MQYDEDAVDDTVLALLYLTLHGAGRAWKGFDFEVMDRLHAKGYILNPIGKAKSVVLTDEGLERSRARFEAKPSEVRSRTRSTLRRSPLSL